MRDKGASGDSSSLAGLTTITRGAAASIAIEVLGLGLGYFVQLMLARWLGVAEYGRYSFVLTLAILVSIPAQLGLNTAILRYLPEYQVTGDRPRAAGFLRRCYEVPLLISAALALIGCLCAYVGRQGGWEYASPLLVGIWAAPFLVLSSLNIHTGRALGRFTTVKAWQDIGRPVLLIAFIGPIGLLGYGLGSVAALAMFVFAALGAVAMQCIATWRMLPKAIVEAAPRFETRSWLYASFPFLLTAAFSIIMKQTDILMIGALGEAEDVGIYAVAARVSTLVALVLTGVNMLAAPSYAGLFAQRQPRRMQELASKLAHVVFWPSLAIALALIVMGKWLLSLFGAPFVAGYTAVLILIAAELVNAGAGSVGYLANVTGNQWAAARVQGIGAVLNVALNWILIPIYGIEGAAVATATTLILWNLWLHAIVSARVGVRASILFAVPRALDFAKRYS